MHGHTKMNSYAGKDCRAPSWTSDWHWWASLCMGRGVACIHLGELGAVAHDVLVGGAQHVELQAGHLRRKLARALLLVPHVVHAAHLRTGATPCCYLHEAIM